MKASRWKRIVVLFLSGMAVAHVLAIWELRDYIVQGSSDFAAFYTAGKLVQRGRAREMYSLRAQWDLQQEFAADVKLRRGPLPYIHPPFEALLYLPLAYLPYPVASWTWLAFKLCILVLIAVLLRPYVVNEAPLPAVAGAGLSLGIFPIAVDLVLGQDAILLTLCFALAFVALRRRAEFLSGLFLTLGLFKFHLVIPVVLVMVLKKKWSVAFGFLAGTAVVFLISLALVGWSGVVSYPTYLLQLDAAANVGVAAPEVMPNFRVPMTALVRWSGLPALGLPLSLVLALIGAVLTAAVWAIRLRRTRHQRGILPLSGQHDPHQSLRLRPGHVGVAPADLDFGQYFCRGSRPLEAVANHVYRRGGFASVQPAAVVPGVPNQAVLPGGASYFIAAGCIAGFGNQGMVKFVVSSVVDEGVVW